MEATNPAQSGPSGKSPAGSFRELLADAIRFWEPRRVIYNLILAAATMTWLVATWPHFRPALTWDSLLFLVVAALLANACYCAAYLVDIPMQCSAVSRAWRWGRWGLWLAGMLFGLLLANYWIADEIYPYVGR